MANSRSWYHIDWMSILPIGMLSSIGILFVFSATYTPECPCSPFFKKQLLGLGIAWLLYIICSFIDYRTLVRWSYFLYITVIGLLLFTMIKGSIGMGAQRWINLFFFKAQPSELAKLFFPGFMVYYLYTSTQTFSFSYRHYIPIILTLGLTTLLVIKQPDLGTALLLFFTGISMLWLAGLNKKIFLYGGIIALLAAPIGYNLLKEYQKQRIAVFLGAGDNQKERYQIEQAHIAVGSGGFYGKGFLHGTQNKLFFLPESRTDFIFAVLCEEWGFLGALLVLILYATLFFHLLSQLTQVTSPFFQLLGAGLLLHILLATIINIGMVLGLLPIVGIPLPLMSYGLSNLWVTFMSLGWLNGIINRGQQAFTRVKK